MAMKTRVKIGIGVIVFIWLCTGVIFYITGVLGGILMSMSSLVLTYATLWVYMFPPGRQNKE